MVDTYHLLKNSQKGNETCGIHRRDEHELRGKSHRPRRARNGYATFFERLAHRLQHTALEFRQLVQEQNAVVRE